MITPNFTLMWPCLATTNDKGRHEITMRFQKTTGNPVQDISPDVVNAAKAEAHANWGMDESKWPCDVLLYTIRDGDTILSKTGEVKHAGYWVIKATTNHMPGMVDANLQEILNPADEFYSGAVCRADISTWAYNDRTNNNYGVGWNLNHLQKIADGERIGEVRQSAAAVFGGSQQTPQQPTTNNPAQYQQATAQPQQPQQPQQPAAPAPQPPANTGRMW